jgi:hexosaminidase
MLKVIPAPVSVQDHEGAPFVLSPTTTVEASGNLAPLARWFMSTLDASTGIVIAAEPNDEVPAIRLEIVQEHEGLSSLPATGGLRADDGDPDAERYALEVSDQGILVRAFTPEGVFRGLTTLIQIAATSAVSHDIAMIPAMTILDAPRFAWRGLSFDVVRRSYTVDEVKQVINLLALYKANVLHLHLTDAEGWRIEIDAWPKLAEVASTTAVGDRPGGYFTKAQFADIVAYAAERFMTVVPEVEMPGHAAAIFRAYPELAGNGIDPSTTNLDRSPWFQVMHPDNPGIFAFLKDVLGEIAALSPSPYLHVGGDEALGMDPALYGRFMQEAREVVYSLGRKVVAWQETSRSGFAADDIAQIWLEPSIHDMDDEPEPAPVDDAEMTDEDKAVSEAFGYAHQIAPLDLGKILDQGPTILMSLQPVSYLDIRYREPSADPAQEDDHGRIGAPFYGTRTVQDFYMWDPATIRPEIPLSRITGVEGTIWCETVESSHDLFFLLLPRLPGILEKGWSAAGTEDTTWDQYASRLAAQDVIWERRGWPYFRSSGVWSSRD